MEKKFTQHFKSFVNATFILTILLFTSITVSAQGTCNNEKVLWLETFGTGTTSTTHPDVLFPALFYQGSGELASEGSYRVINNTQQKPEWHASTDHTGDVNGKMLVINGQAETYYQHEITKGGFAEGSYMASLYIMNIDPKGLCGPDALLTVTTFNVEYLSQANTWVPLSGSPYTAAPLPQTDLPVWVHQGATFVLPSTGNFVVTKIRITLTDGTTGGCGNDFALDDIKFSLCPEGAPAPVTFLNINAHQKGSGVNIDWSTSQELNNEYFEVQRSADGNTNWNTVATVNGAGNSQIVKNYNAYDSKPISGLNYYRIKQVDKDGKFKFSKTVTVKLNLEKASVSILANPFHNSLSVDFSSSSAQVVSARLLDITGKQVAFEKWSIAPGNSRKDFSNINGLQPGMYILSVTTVSGEVLYNNKVIKQ